MYALLSNRLEVKGSKIVEHPRPFSSHLNKSKTSEVWHAHWQHYIYVDFQVYLLFQHCLVILAILLCFQSLVGFDKSHRYVSNAKQKHVRRCCFYLPRLFYLGLFKAVKKSYGLEILSRVVYLLTLGAADIQIYINGKNTYKI